MKFNKKADIPSLIYVIIAVFIIGILLFFSNHLTNSLYGGLDDYFGNSTKYVDSEARTSLQEIRTAENTSWDYATLAIMVGLFITLIGTAYSTRISSFFFWLYVFISLFALGLGVMASNIWQEMAANPEFSGTLTRFPITNAILGTNYPLVVTAFVMILVIFLFGKFPGGNQE